MNDWLSIMRSLNAPSVPALRGFNGSGEALATLGSGMAGMVAGGLRGVPAGLHAAYGALNQGGSWQDARDAGAQAAGDALERTQEAMTYQPKTAEGEAALRPVQKVGELWQRLAVAAGGLGDTPASQTAIQTAVENADAFFPPLKAALGAAALAKIGGKAGQVGKHIGGAVYVHRSAIDRLPAEARRQLELVDPGFDWHVAKYDPKTGQLSVMESTDFDTADFPTIGRSTVVGSGKVRGPGKDPKIYHHKQTMVGEDYPGFDRARADRITEELLGMEGVDRSRYGSKSFMEQNVIPRMKSLFEDDPPSLWDAPAQKVTSADTSINAGKLPGGFTAAEKLGIIAEGKRVIDIGGGRFDNAVEWGKERGAEVGVYDPFNREQAHNAKVVEKFANGQSDVATINNVLNVIEEPANQLKVLQQAENALKPGGQVVIKIYEGAGDGVAKATSKGFQQNKKTRDYLEMVRQVFPDAEVKSGVIVATKPGKLEGPASGVFAQAELPGGLDPKYHSISSIPTLYDDAVAPLKRGTHTVETLAEEFTRRGREVWGDRNMLEHTDQNVEDISDVLAAETVAALSKDGHAGTWYRDNLEEAHKVVAQRHPEIASDPRHADAFNFALAITSNQMLVKQNAGVALRVYEHWKQTGRFPENIGEGPSAAEMMNGFKKYNAMVDDLGEETVRQFMHTEFTVADLEAAGFKISGEAKDTILPGSVIFGPKIGGGFYQNLSGNFSPLTADRWWTRTFHRITGTLLKDTPDSAAQLSRFESALEKAKANPDSPEGQFLAEALATGKLKSDNVNDVAAFLHKRYARGGFKQKNELARAAKTFDERKAKARVLPESPSERKYMRAVAAKTLEKLRAQGYNIDTADMQALVWFPEQDLWKKMGYPAKPDEVRDYAAAFRELLGDAGAGQAPLRGDVGSRGGRRSTALDGFAPEERDRFTLQRAFAEGANKRTLRRMKAESVFSD